MTPSDVVSSPSSISTPFPPPPQPTQHTWTNVILITEWHHQISSVHLVQSAPPPPPPPAPSSLSHTPEPVSYWLQNYAFWTSVIMITELRPLNQCHTDYRIIPSKPVSYWLQNYTFWTSVILITELYLLNQCHTDYRIIPSEPVSY